MKKQFFVPALIALFLSLSATAGETNPNALPDQNLDAEVGLTVQATNLADHSITARNINGTGHSMWVTIYNTFDSIRDSGCVKEGEERVFTGYYNPMTFRFRAEVTKDVNCGGPKVDDLSLNFAMPFKGDGTAIQLMNGDRGFYLAQHSSRQAQAQAHDEIQVQNKSDRSAWVTIYNTFESIRDVGCVKANDQISFSGYKGPLPFKIRVEVKENVNCGGNTVFDASGTVSLMTAWKAIGILEGSANTGYKFNTKSE